MRKDKKMNELKFKKEQMNKQIFTHKPQIGDASSRKSKHATNVFKRLGSSASADFIHKRELRCEKLRQELMLKPIDTDLPTNTNSISETPECQSSKNQYNPLHAAPSGNSIVNRLLSARNKTGRPLMSYGKKKKKSTPA